MLHAFWPPSWRAAGVRVYAIDPGDMDTQMHRDAEPGEDLSHLPPPSVMAPAFVRLLDRSAPFGRFQGRELLARTASPAQSW